MVIEELQHLITLNPDTGVERLAAGKAMDDRIKEWLETPEGTIADLPAWGSNLMKYKHEPTTATLEVLIETSIITKMPKDIHNLVIRGISVKPMALDLFYVTIAHSIGTYDGEVRL